MAGSYFLSGPLPLPGSGNTIKFTQFTANDTWTKDADCQWVTCIIWNGGAGGGSGRKGASASAGGGGGGAAGNIMIYSAPANMFGATESITIGTGGAGGAAVAADNTNGNPGSTVGTQSKVGNMGPLITASTGGSLGGGGGTTTNSGTALTGWRFGNMPFSTASSSSQTLFGGRLSDIINSFSGARGLNTAGESPSDIGTISTSNNYFNYIYFPGYGGGGGGADTVTERAGGTGSDVLYSGQTTMLAGGTAGLESTGINGGNGANFVIGDAGTTFGGSGGGGGGGYSVGAMGATTGGNGGNGGIPGAGGGGGGGGLNAIANSGSGGTGGRGEIWIYQILG
jgi:hypothetical protein